MAEFDVIGVEYRMNGEAYEQGLKELVAANQKLAAASGKTQEQIQQDINQTAQATQKLKSETTELINEQDKLETGSKSLKSQLRQLKNELALMSEEDPGFLKMAVEAAKLEDKIGDVQQRVRALASDEKLFDALAQGATGLAGAFSAVEGAAALLGKENQDLQKALLRVNAAMALANGLQQVAQTLNKDSAFRVVALAKAQQIYNFVVGQSTGAMKNFRIALASTGIGLFVIALGALIANWDKVKSTLGFGVNPETERLAEATHKATEASKAAVESFDQEERRLRALGMAETDLIKLRQQRINEAIHAATMEKIAQEAILNEMAEARAKALATRNPLKIKLAPSEEQLTEQKKIIDDLQAFINTSNTTVVEGMRTINDLEKEKNKKIADENEKADAKRLEQLRRFQQLSIDLMKEGINKELAQAALNHQLKLDQMKGDHKSMELEEERYYKELADIRKKHSPEEIQIKQIKSVGKIQKEVSKENENDVEKSRKTNEKAMERTAAENRQRNEDDKKEYEQREAAKIELAETASNTIFAIAQQRRQAEFSAELATLNREREAELANKDLTDEQKAAIEEKYRVREAEIKTEQFKKEKAAAIIKATIDGAIAVVSALKTGPIAAGLAAAFAASQIAIIASQPIPQFAKGTDDAPGGFALVGEKGPEMMYVPKGAMITPADKTKAFAEEISAMRKGTYSDLITTKYVLPQLKAVHEAKTTAERMAASAALQFDDSEINYNLRKIKPATSKDIAALKEAIIKDNKYGRFLNKTEVRL